MKKIFLFSIVWIAAAVQAFAQPSVAEVSKILAEADWQTKEITGNITLRQVQLTLFGAQQSIHILEIIPDGAVRLGIHDVSDTLIGTSELCRQVNAIAGINASFFDMKNGGSVDFVRVNGTVLHKTAKRTSRNNAALAIDSSTVRILARDTTIAEWENTIDSRNVLVAGPLVMKDGLPARLQESAFNQNRHPRTFVATKSDGAVLLVVVDGRNTRAAGMSIPELYVLSEALDCRDAMNFDGGGSSTMYVRGENENGIVNYPSDNKLFDHYGERRVANIIYVKATPGQPVLNE
ncbi:MAG: phosphodiester glycosidase family protein [Prevotellaceae bacterium]|jgi:exopolysaccharide biosynthesis protein|nr:phosphodiester glycosidase family protein [Prevotellaceae bacterium]